MSPSYLTIRPFTIENSVWNFWAASPLFFRLKAAHHKFPVQQCNQILLNNSISLASYSGWRKPWYHLYFLILRNALLVWAQGQTCTSGHTCGILDMVTWKYVIHYMKDKLKSVEYFLLCLLQDTTLPLFIAIFELMSAVCALSNFYGSRRRFPPWTE